MWRGGFGKRIGFFVVKATNRTPARIAESSYVQGPFLTDLIDQSPVESTLLVGLRLLHIGMRKKNLCRMREYLNTSVG